MNTLWAVIFLVCGLIVLWKSAELLVSGAVALAERLGISKLVVGLTVVAMGTSAPEVAASIASALRGAGDIAIGNVYGSNIANLALVGGLVAVIRPLRVQTRTLRREIPIMLLVGLFLWPFLADLHLARLEGAILLGVFVLFIGWTVFAARKESLENSDNNCQRVIGGSTKTSVVLVLIGLVGLALGAEITLRGAVFIGEKAGLSKAVIGLTIIAIGTSLPELVTCVVAAVKGHHDISVGNLVGSNIFNTLLVTGSAVMVRPFAIAGRLKGVDFVIMIAASALFAGLAIFGRGLIRRSYGILLLAGYVGFIVYTLAISG